MTSLIDLLHLEYDEDDLDGGEMPNLFEHSPYYSNEETIQVLKDKNNLLNILSLNCQSILSKFNQLQVYIDYYNNFGISFSVICIQETWLSKDHDVTSLQIDGYYFIYKPKVASLHGGVAFYIKNTLDYTILPTTINDDICDSFFIEINQSSSDNYGNGKVILGNIYRPPRDLVANYNSFTTDVEHVLSQLQRFSNIAILGDFNIDLMKLNEKEYINDFFNMMLSKGFIPKITLPTRLTQNSKTLIDNCFVKTMNSLSGTTSGIILQNISDHQPYFVCFDNLKIQRNKNKLIKNCIQTDAALEKFKQELKETCVIEKFNTLFNNVNENYEILDDTIQTAMKKHIPTSFVKYNKHRHKNTNWITQGIMHSIKFRDKLYYRLKHTSISSPLHETLRINLKTYNRILKQMIRKAKQEYYHVLFEKYKNDIKKTWETIRNVINSDTNNKSFPKYFNIDDIPINDSKEIANHFNKYFIEIGPRLAREIPHITDMQFHDYLGYPPNCNLIFQNITESEVLKVIDSLKPKTSYGIDSISNKLLKLIKLEIIEPLTLIINQTLDTGSFPNKLKISKVQPVYKKGDIHSLENYRPISLLPSVSKVFEKIIHNQLFNHFTQNNLFIDNQYGFRRNHSTEMAALELVDRIVCSMDVKKLSLGIFLDLSKAFDTLDHSIILDKLKHYGIKDTALELLKSYLNGREQIVQHNDTL